MNERFALSIVRVPEKVVVRVLEPRRTDLIENLGFTNVAPTGKLTVGFEIEAVPHRTAAAAGYRHGVFPSLDHRWINAKPMLNGLNRHNQIFCYCSITRCMGQ